MKRLVAFTIGTRGIRRGIAVPRLLGRHVNALLGKPGVRVVDIRDPAS